MKKQKAITHQVDAVVMHFFKKCFPIYIRFKPTWIWFAAWSGPMEPSRWYQYFKALRITIRYGRFHSKILLTFKKGNI
jgi:hypothetical protein